MSLNLELTAENASSRSPFVVLGRDVFEKILGIIAGEPLDRDHRMTIVSTDAIRLILPFALCCKQHYEWAIGAVRHLSVLPLRFSTTGGTNRHSVDTMLPFPAILDPEFQHSPANQEPPRSRIVGVGRISTADLIRAVICFPNLITLHLSLAVTVTDLTLQAIAEKLGHLQELRIPGNRTITKRGVEFIATHCKQMKLLNLAYCRQLGDECAPAVASMTTLKSLDVTYWRISDQFVHEVAQLPNLKELELGVCNLLSDESCTSLSNHAAGLERVVLRGAPLLTDTAVTNLRPLLNLNEIDLSLSRNISDQAVAALGDKLSFPSLKTVLLSNITIVDFAVRSLACNCGIQVLDLSHCSLLTDAAARFLTPLSGLEELDMSGCGNITDAAVEHISRLPCLSKLRLSYCRRLTDGIADPIETNKAWGLQLLEIRKCRGVTENGINRLQAVCKQVIY